MALKGSEIDENEDSPACCSTTPEDSPSTSNAENAEKAGSPSPITSSRITESKSPDTHQLPSTSKGKQRSAQYGCPEDCAVCGDAATGYHYEVASCNGCKTFFRRTILDQRVFACKKSCDCFSVLTKEKRCQCRACRFQKCVEVGMNPIAIVTKDDLSKNQMFMTLLTKRNSMNEESRSDQKVHKPLTQPENTINKLFDGLLYLEIKHEALRKSTYNPRANCGLNIDKILANSSIIGTKLKKMPDWPLPPQKKAANWLTTICDHVDNRVPLPAIDYEKLLPNFKSWFYVDLIYAIEWARTFEFFHKLDSADQKNLIKCMTWQCSNMTSSYFSYSNNSDTTLFPDGRVSYMWKPRGNRHHNVIPLLMRLKVDRTEYVLIKTLALCNPSWEILSDGAKKIIESYKEQYANALFNYCMTRCGATEGPSRYSLLLTVLDTLICQAKTIKDTHMLISLYKLRPQPVSLIDEMSD